MGVKWGYCGIVLQRGRSTQLINNMSSCAQFVLYICNMLMHLSGIHFISMTFMSATLSQDGCNYFCRCQCDTTSDHHAYRDIDDRPARGDMDRDDQLLTM